MCRNGENKGKFSKKKEICFQIFSRWKVTKFFEETKKLCVTFIIDDVLRQTKKSVSFLASPTRGNFNT